jgi:small-conductance mechanosensitive channel
MPGTMPTMVWEWVVIFGLGATLVALVIQFAAIALFKVAAWPALAGFITSAAVILLASGLLPSGFKTLIAWTIGAMLASLLARVTSNHSSKPSPLRELV